MLYKVIDKHKIMNIKDIISDKITYDALTIMIPEKQTIMMYRVSKEIHDYLHSVKLGIHVKISKFCNKFPDISILLHKLEELNKNISIRSISFTGYHFEGVTGEAIIKELFNDRHCTISNEDSRSSNTGCTITSLDFSYNNLDVNARHTIAEALFANTTLKDLVLRNIELEKSEGYEIIDALRNNKTITSLDIGKNNEDVSENYYTDDDYEEYEEVFTNIEKYLIAIANMIKENSTIVKLNLEKNCLGDFGIYEIADALRYGTQEIVNALCMNTTITTLNLDNNYIGKYGIHELANALRVNTTITNLNLSRNYLREYGTQEIADVLYTNTTITTLNLSSNSLGKNGSLIIAELLYVNTTLRSLDLSHNYLRRHSFCSEIGIIAIANALCKNNTITELNLEHNKIGLNGALELSKALCVNKTIKILNLEHNKLRERGACAIAEALCVNTTLQCLNLNNNKLEKYEVHAIINALCNNNTITSLHLVCNELGKNERKEVRDALCKNHTLTEFFV